MKEIENEKQYKCRFTVWMKESTMERVSELYKQDDCRSKSEFVERALLFYISYIMSKNKNQFLPAIVTSTLKSIVRESDNRMERVIFKLAVELAVTMNLIASSQSVSEEQIKTLRHNCIQEVKKVNGLFNFNDALDWQRGRPRRE